MTEASGDPQDVPPQRQSRYARQPDKKSMSLTLLKRIYLLHVANFGVVSLPQLALMTDHSLKSTARHMRDLFDMGFVDVVAIPRAALAESQESNDAGLLFGSAPNIYTLTRMGAKVLVQTGELVALPPVLKYGPKNHLFLAHELGIRDVRVWLTRMARSLEGHRIERWRDGVEAHIDLERTHTPRVARPDAWFVYGFGKRVLLGLVELDRGTERGGTRWLEKLAAYGTLFQTGKLKEATGYSRARILVVVPNAARRDALANLIHNVSSSGLAERFWLAERSCLEQPEMTQAIWRIPGDAQLRPLLSPELLSEESD